MKKDLTTLQKELKILNFHLNMSSLNANNHNSNAKEIDKGFTIRFSKEWTTLIQNSINLDWVDWDKFSVYLSVSDFSPSKYICFGYELNDIIYPFFQIGINDIPVLTDSVIDTQRFCGLKISDACNMLELVQGFFKIIDKHPNVWESMKKKALQYNSEKQTSEKHYKNYRELMPQIEMVEDLIEAHSIKREFHFTPYSYLQDDTYNLHLKSVEVFKNYLIELFPQLKNQFETKNVIITSAMKSITLKQWSSNGRKRNRGCYMPILYIPINKPFILSNKVYLKLKEKIY